MPCTLVQNSSEARDLAGECAAVTAASSSSYLILYLSTNEAEDEIQAISDCDTPTFYKDSFSILGQPGVVPTHQKGN